MDYPTLFGSIWIWSYASTRNGLYYDVNYSERYNPGEEDPFLKETGEEFINSFQFNK